MKDVSVLEVEHKGKNVLLIQDKFYLGYTSFYNDGSSAVGQGQTKEESLISLEKSYELLKNWEKNDRG